MFRRINIFWSIYIYIYFIEKWDKNTRKRTKSYHSELETRNLLFNIVYFLIKDFKVISNKVNKNNHEMNNDFSDII